MEKKISFEASTSNKPNSVEDFFRIIITNYKISHVLFTYNGKSDVIPKLSGLYTPEEFEKALNSLIETIRISIMLNENFPKQFVLETIADIISHFKIYEIYGTKRIFQEGFQFQGFMDDYWEEIGIESKTELGLELTLKFSEIKFQALKKLEEVVLTSGYSKSNNEKLKTRLSVGDLSLLFRLLYDEGLFELKSNTELYQFISSNFSTKSAEDISDKSIKNKFLSPDNSSTKNLDILLTNLRQQLRKIQ